MRTKNCFFNIVLVFMLMISACQLHAQTVVITNSSNSIHGLDTDELAKIYLGKLKKFSNGEHIVAANQPVDFAIRKQFSKKVLAMSADKVDRYWAKRKYVRNIATPKVLKGDAAVKAWVAATPNSLGYIDSKSVDGSVKILLILP